MRQTVFIIIFIMLTLLALSFFLQKEKQPHAGSHKMKVVTSFTILADMARHVAGDAAVVASITKPGAEIHDYQPTPKDIARAQGADLVLWNGLNLERWFERFLQQVGDVPHVVLSEGVTPLSIYEGAYAGKPNPHAWMSTRNALLYVENIRRAFVAQDPENAAIYNANAASYTATIKAWHATVEDALRHVPEAKRVLVTSEGAFSYLAQELGMEELYLWPINAEQQGTPQQVRRVIDVVRQRQLPVVFSESTVSDKPARQVAAETGALYGGVLYVDSLSDAQGPVPTYLDLLRVTTQTIINGFERGENE